MVNYLFKRLLIMFVVLIMLSIFIFFLVHILPGDPISVAYAKAIPLEQIKELKKHYGLDLPIYKQYINWIYNIFHGKFGLSISDGSPVFDLVLERIPRTLVITFGSLFLSLLLAIPAGIVSAWKRGSWTDFNVSNFSLFVLSIPQFWMGIFLIIIFSVKLKLLPSSGWISPSEDFVGFLKIITLPIITTAFTNAAGLTRMVRSSMIETLDSDYILLAAAKGNPMKRILIIHSLRNSLIPIITVAGFQIGYLLGGEIVVEQVFNCPGMGTLILRAIESRDYPVIQISILFYALLFMFITLIVDLSYPFIDPTVKY